MTAHLDDAAARAGYAAVGAVLEATRRVGGPVAVAEALAAAHRRLLRPGLGALRQRISEDLIAESRRTGRRGDTLVGLLCRTVDLILDRDPRAARCLTELRLLAGRDGDPAITFMVSAIEVMFEIRAGRLARAEQLAARCAKAGAAARHPAAARWYGSHMILIRWYQGRVAELLPAIRGLATDARSSPVDYSYRSALAVAAALAGRREEALGALNWLTDRKLSAMPPSASSLVTLYGVVEAAYLLGAADPAILAYELLVPYAHLPVTAGPAIACFGSAKQALGLAKLTTGEHDEAVAHLRAAVSENLALGHWPAATLARHRLALALRPVGRPGHRHLATREDDAARREAIDLGLTLPSGDGPRPALPDCRRQGRYWQIRAVGRLTVVEHCRGMTYLAALLADPGREIAAVDLAVAPRDAATHAGRAAADPGAIQRYRDRLAELQRDIERADRLGDRQAGIHADAERDEILGRLQALAGPAGPVSASFIDTSGIDPERARVAVGKALRRALRRIAAVDREVADLIGASVHTGRYCVYLPAGPR